MKLIALLTALALAAPASARIAPPPATWASGVRLDVSGEAGEDPYVAVLMMESTGKVAPLSQTASGSATVRVTLRPAEARALAEALRAWADSPTSETLFVAVR